MGRARLSLTRRLVDSFMALQLLRGDRTTLLIEETIMANANAVRTTRGNASVPNAKALNQISDTELDQVSGSFFPFVALGVALGIAYCIADGTLDPPPAPKGDFNTGPKNV